MNILKFYPIQDGLMVVHQISMVPTVLILQAFFTTAITIIMRADLVESGELYLRTGKSIPKVVGPKKNSVT